MTTPDLIAAVIRFAATASPEERADLAALLPVVLGRRARLRVAHVAAQGKLSTTSREDFADAAVTRLLTMLRGRPDDLG